MKRHEPFRTAHAKPLTGREIELVRHLIEPRRARFWRERQGAVPELLGAVLDAVLEALPTAALILSPRGTVEIANQAGMALLERRRENVLAAIVGIDRPGSRGGSELDAFSVTRLKAPGLARYLLAIEKPSAGLAARASLAQKRWRLTAGQTRVLELIATGASNKEIATTLDCAEVTVEKHVTNLFRRSGASSRAGLVGRLLDTI